MITLNAEQRHKDITYDRQMYAFCPHSVALICHVILRHICPWCLAVQLEKQLPLLELIRLTQTTIMEIGTEISKKIRVSNSAG